MSLTVTERPSSSSGSSSTSPAAAAVKPREIDPLLKDLSEKKQSFRRNVVSLATELKDVRSRLSSQEQSFVRESLTRQEAENKAKKMEEEINRLQKSLDDRSVQLQASAASTEKGFASLKCRSSDPILKYI